MAANEFDRTTIIDPTSTPVAETRSVHTLPPRSVTTLEAKEPINPPRVKIATTKPN
jgi:hypothetical protein